MHVPRFIYTNGSGHLELSPVLSYYEQCFCSVLVFFSGNKYSHLFTLHLEVEMLDHRVDPCNLTFADDAKQIFKVCDFKQPAAMFKSSHCSTFSPVLSDLLFLPFYRGMAVFYCGFN